MPISAQPAVRRVGKGGSNAVMVLRLLSPWWGPSLVKCFILCWQSSGRCMCEIETEHHDYLGSGLYMAVCRHRAFLQLTWYSAHKPGNLKKTINFVSSNAEGRGCKNQCGPLWGLWGRLCSVPLSYLLIASWLLMVFGLYTHLSPTQTSISTRRSPWHLCISDTPPLSHKAPVIAFKTNMDDSR